MFYVFWMWRAPPFYSLLPSAMWANQKTLSVCIVKQTTHCQQLFVFQCRERTVPNEPQKKQKQLHVFVLMRCCSDDEADNNGQSPLLIAAMYGHAANVDKLLQCRADVDKARRIARRQPNIFVRFDEFLFSYFSFSSCSLCFLKIPDNVVSFC